MDDLVLRLAPQGSDSKGPAILPQVLPAYLHMCMCLYKLVYMSQIHVMRVDQLFTETEELAPGTNRLGRKQRLLWQWVCFPLPMVLRAFV